ncbi:MAG: transposase [Planctomycetales bacterium]|nr:transposase [Planctomycetales bacterium]
MATQHSVDFREGLLAALDAGLPIGEAVSYFQVSVSTIRRWRVLKRTTGSAAPRPGRGRRSRLAGAGDTRLLALVEQSPAATLAELGQWLDAQMGVHVSPSTICRRLHRLGITRKKGRWLPASRMRPSGQPGDRRLPSSIPPN